MSVLTVIYNCTRCKVARRVEYPIQRGRDQFYRLDARGVHQPATVWVNATGGGKPTEYGGDVEMGICGQCKRLMKPGILKGILSPGHKCDARCTGSRGPNCECQCGGKNHGSAWAA